MKLEKLTEEYFLSWLFVGKNDYLWFVCIKETISSKINNTTESVITSINWYER